MIINKTKNVVIAETVFLANTPFKRMKGLLGRNSLEINQSLILKPCNSIHTFFMRFPIDVLFVGDKFKVIKAISNILPWRLSPLCLRSHFVIELPAGRIIATDTSSGDELTIE
ncbi:MAG: DUF192 domain-containing protein [Candidatus Omnitrophica bacterium]|nr:DUF192 domain-containing protein [Candidatus Omnitrophota bacterium]